MVAVLCPFCHKPDSVIKHGTNRGGTLRLRCRACNKTFTPAPNPRALSPQKEQLILNALAERISQHGIARALGVSRMTVRKVRKKTHGT
jgi:Transposase and inactivated derivatives